MGSNAGSVRGVGLVVMVFSSPSGSGSMGDVAAIDDQVVSVDERGPGGGEKEDDFGHLFGLAKAPNRKMGEGALVARGVLGIAVPVELRGDGPRADGVDNNAVASQFERHRAGQVNQRRLGQAVERQFGTGHHAHLARHVLGRAGAGVNNIPVDKLSKLGIPVFNAPGANAKAVKERGLAGLLLAARNICQAWDYTRQLEGDDAELGKQVEAGKKKYGGKTINDMYDLIDKSYRLNSRSRDIILIHDHNDTTKYFNLLINHLLKRGIKFIKPKLK